MARSTSLGHGHSAVLRALLLAGALPGAALQLSRERTTLYDTDPLGIGGRALTLAPPLG